jgi:hypothetical protein
MVTDRPTDTVEDNIKWVNNEESQIQKPYKWDSYYPVDPFCQDEYQEINLNVTNCNSNTYTVFK